MQRKEESVAVYVNAMRLIFGAMSNPLRPQHQVLLIRQNLHPQYSSIVALHSPQTIEDVLRICKEIECTKGAEYDIESSKSTFSRPTPRKVNVTEQVATDSSEEENDSHSDNDEESTVTAIRAPKNAKSIKMAKKPTKNSETSSECKIKWPKHCFRCGTQ